MKYIITIEPGEPDYEKDEHNLEDIDALLNASKNKRLIDEMYDQVFRPVIRYSNDEIMKDKFETVWEKVWEYLNK